MEKNKEKQKQKRIMDSITAETKVLQGVKSDIKEASKEIKSLNKERDLLTSQVEEATTKAKAQKEKLEILSQKAREADSLLIEVGASYADSLASLGVLDMSYEAKNSELEENYKAKELATNKKISLLDKQIEKYEDKAELIKLDSAQIKSEIKVIEKDLAKNKQVAISQMEDTQELADIHSSLQAEVDSNKSELLKLKEGIRAAEITSDNLSNEIADTNSALKKAVSEKAEIDKELEKSIAKRFSLSNREKDLDQREAVIKEAYKQAGVQYS